MVENLSQYESRCKELGATEARIVSIKETVVLSEWVRLKCQFGCKEYGQHLVCPPYTPDFKTCYDIVHSYETGLLIAFVSQEVNRSPDAYVTEKNKIRRTLSRIERQLILDQYYKAISLHNGPCTLCQTCVLNEPEGHKKPQCRFHKVARPAMEAMCIDVFETVRRAGWEAKMLSNFFEQPTYYGLVLIK